MANGWQATNEYLPVVGSRLAESSQIAYGRWAMRANTRSEDRPSVISRTTGRGRFSFGDPFCMWRTGPVTLLPPLPST